MPRSAHSPREQNPGSSQRAGSSPPSYGRPVQNRCGINAWPTQLGSTAPYFWGSGSSAASMTSTSSPYPREVPLARTGISSSDSGGTCVSLGWATYHADTQSTPGFQAPGHHHPSLMPLCKQPRTWNLTNAFLLSGPAQHLPCTLSRVVE